MAPYSLFGAEPPAPFVQRQRSQPTIGALKVTVKVAPFATLARFTLVRAVGSVTPAAFVCNDPSGSTTREMPRTQSGSVVASAYRSPLIAVPPSASSHDSDTTPKRRHLTQSPSFDAEMSKPADPKYTSPTLLRICIVLSLRHSDHVSTTIMSRSGFASVPVYTAPVRSGVPTASQA